MGPLSCLPIIYRLPVPAHVPLPHPLRLEIPLHKIPTLQRQIWCAQCPLPQHVETVLDVRPVRICAVREDVAEVTQTVHLVKHSDEECPVLWTDANRALLVRRGVEPLVVGDSIAGQGIVACFGGEEFDGLCEFKGEAFGEVFVCIGCMFVSVEQNIEMDGRRQWY